MMKTRTLPFVLGAATACGLAVTLLVFALRLGILPVQADAAPSRLEGVPRHARRADRRLLAPTPGVGDMTGHLNPIPRGPRSALGTALVALATCASLLALTGLIVRGTWLSTGWIIADAPHLLRKAYRPGCMADRAVSPRTILQAGARDASRAPFGRRG